MSKTNDIKSVIERMIQNGVIPMDEADYDRCMFTGDLLDDIPFTIYNEKEININELYENTLNSFTMYNDKDLLTRLSDLLKSIKIYKDNGFHGIKIYNFRTLLDTINRKDNGFYGVKGIVIPGRYNGLAHIYFGHEAHHALKDTNPKEYIFMLQLADVIPMFFELVQAEQYEEAGQKAIINNRLALLKGLSNELKVDKTGGASFLQNALKSKKYQYLNSFYYSVLLYRLYKDNPDYILNLVKMVLNGQMTTYDLINKLDINSRSLDYDVHDEINVLKKK